MQCPGDGNTWITPIRVEPVDYASPRRPHHLLLTEERIRWSPPPKALGDGHLPDRCNQLDGVQPTAGTHITGLDGEWSRWDQASTLPVPNGPGLAANRRRKLTDGAEGPYPAANDHLNSPTFDCSLHVEMIDADRGGYVVTEMLPWAIGLRSCNLGAPHHDELRHLGL
jgi:hypothetical protein